MTNVLQETNQVKSIQNVETSQMLQNEQIQTLDNQERNKQDLVTKEQQNGFLNSTIGKVINTAIDLGLRWALPDFIENQVIDVKNSLVKGGLKEGIDKAVESAVEIGKTVSNIFTGKFDSISQAQNAIKNGGIIDSVSDVLDSALAVTSKKRLAL